MTDKPGNAHDDERLDDEPAVARAYDELRTAGPPARLDARILAAARRAAASEDPAVVTVHRWRAWTRYAALAATVVVAVPLVVTVVDRQIVAPVSEPATTAADDADLAASRPEPLPSPVAQTRRSDDRAFVPAPAPVTPSADSAARPATDAAEASARTASQALGNATAEQLRDNLPAVAAEATDATAVGPHRDAIARFAAPPAATAAPRPEADLQRRAATNESSLASTAPADASAAAAKTGGPAAGELATVKGQPTDPRIWLDGIEGLLREGRVRAARVQLGRLLAAWPDYRLPEAFPLRAADAIAADAASAIVPAADDWLRDIGKLAERGRIDLARAEFAEWLQRYPDRELPEDFPLRRADGAPIER